MKITETLDARCNMHGQKMVEPEFFTRSEKAAFLIELVKENSIRNFDVNDLKTLFGAVDQYCATHFPSEDRGGWFSPTILGGAPLAHTPPHIMCAVYAIYADMARGCPEPVSFLGGALNWTGATAVCMNEETKFVISDRDRLHSPISDVLFVHPANFQDDWISDFYGVPSLSDGVSAIGWHASAKAHFASTCSGLLLVHHSRKLVINPISITNKGKESWLFDEPISNSKLGRHRERLVEFLATPLDVLQENHENARKLLKAFITKRRIPVE
jgi:hypothetical protein